MCETGPQSGVGDAHVSTELPGRVSVGEWSRGERSKVRRSSWLFVWSGDLAVCV